MQNKDLKSIEAPDDSWECPECSSNNLNSTYTCNYCDISEAGISKAIKIARQKNVDVNFWVQDLADFLFGFEYDVILSHGVLHLPEKNCHARAFKV